MNYDEFVCAVVDCVKNNLEEECDVTIHKVTKNNGLILDGLVIMGNGRKYSPTIYLNDFYDRYMQGATIEQIAAGVYKIYLENVDKLKLPENFFMNFIELKDKIAFRLVNYERNEKMLSGLPHRRWKDLALVYYVVYENIDIERAIVTIHNNHLDLWKVDEEILYKHARKNTPKLYPAELTKMSDLVKKMMQESGENTELFESVDISAEIPMYVLTNTYRNYGATTILYEDVLKKFSRELGKDVFIIPSSVHEVILIPAEEKMCKESLEEMVECVNNTEVTATDILSYNVYLFKCGEGFAD